jgi:starch phosphorylase
MRLCQEIVLGIGGVLALRALGVEPAVWHINEGHSALLILRRIRNLIEQEGRSFHEAAEEVRKNTIFTTHTPVPAGNEAYDLDLVRKYFVPYAQACGISLDELLQWGRAHPDHQDGSFNLTALAIRGSCSTNGVSELHGQVASAMWRHLWPAEAGPRPIGFITNGVHIPTWMGPEMEELLRRRLGDRFDSWLFDRALATALEEIPDTELWEAHAAQKLRLVLFVRQRMLDQFARHGRSPDELRAVQSLLDPSALTIGFARRFATYKRAALIFQDLDRLRTILTDSQRPVQLLFAGKAHPADRPGQDLIRAIFQASLSPEFRGRIVFLENYNIRIARHLVQGVDLWLNTPRRPQEASGTSGMKAAINGGLNFSVMDGWWSEGYDPEHGWVIGQPKDYEDAGTQDRETRLPIRWIRRMKRALGSLAPRFTAARLIRDYTETYYLPVGRSATSKTLERYRSG